jgi:hypothetical protein
MTRRGLPRNLLDLAVLARRYDQEAHAPLMSVGVQRLLLAPLVFAARHLRSFGRRTRFANTLRECLNSETLSREVEPGRAIT